MLSKTCFLLALAAFVAASPVEVDPDEKLDLAQMVASRGYILQAHEVTTEDGYILTIHRVVPFIDDYLKTGVGLNMSDFFTMFTGKTLSQCRVGDAENVCYKFLVDLTGNTTHMDHKRTIVYVKYFPASISMWQVVHFGQNHLSGKFAHLDFKDAKKNMAAYGSEHPPEYRLEKISPKAKIIIAWGSTDIMVSPEDVQHLIQIVKPVLKENLIEYKVPSDPFNHVDFLIGKDSGKLVGDQTIGWLDQFA